MTILFILLIVSFAINGTMIGFLANKPKEIEVEKVVYREIEVARPGCECNHPSSVHDENGCHQQLMMLDGIKTSKSYKCFCKRYSGPEVLPSYYPAPLALSS